MKVISSIILMLVIFLAGNAQQNPIKDGGKKKTGINKPSGNPGDPNNAFKGQQQQKDSANQTQTGAEQETGDNDRSLLGDDNDKANGRKGDARDNYRSNRVSGNPNNRNADEGSNRRSGSGETGESSTGVSNDSTSVPLSSSGAVSNPESSNVPAISQESTSGSGSPAILSGDKGGDRDGTNNVQRAKPNMAGSPVGNLRSGKKDIDPDTEIKEGTDRQQRNPASNKLKKTRSDRKVSGGENPDKVTPVVRPESQNASESEAVQKEDENTSGIRKEESTRADKKSERKAKRKKRRNN